MERAELQQYLNGLGQLSFEEGGEWINLFAEPAAFRTLMETLRNDEQLKMDYLFCLTCVDWKTHLTMVYHLSSTRYRYNIVVKLSLTARSRRLRLFVTSGAQLNFTSGRCLNCLEFSS